VSLDGKRLVDDSFILIFNSSAEPVDFVLPSADCGAEWHIVIDTHRGVIAEPDEAFRPGDVVTVPDRSVLVLRCPDEESNQTDF
jgi:isoamylase